MSNGFSWFQPPGRTPQLSDLDHKPFLRRHFWPPSAFGMVVIALVAAVGVGFLGALVYTSSDNAKLAVVDPADESRVAPTLPPDTSAVTTTTKPIEILNADGIAKKAGPSVWAVTTLDEAGKPVEGTAFVAGSAGGQTFLLTSLSIVRAATRIPGPEIKVRGGGGETQATLWTWQEERDLALLTVDRTAASLNWTDRDPPAKAGDKVFVAGGAGTGVGSGTISSISPAGIQHDVPVDDKRLGAPLLNDRGQVLGIVTRAAGGPGSALPMAVTCERVLTCGGGNTDANQPGQPGPTTTTTATPARR